MSRLQRAVAKAEREGLLAWTGREDTGRTAALREPDRAAARVSTRRSRLAGRGRSHRGVRSKESGHLSPLFVAATHPTSPAAEQYRLLRTRLEGRDRGRRAQLVLVTSPGPGDGKTTTSANLALTMAQDFNHSVVLVEADMRRPTLAGLCGISPGARARRRTGRRRDARRRAWCSCPSRTSSSSCRPGDRPIGRAAGLVDDDAADRDACETDSIESSSTLPR